LSRTGAPIKSKVTIGRNDPCPCGSGRKYKLCCQAKEVTVDLAAPWAQSAPAPKTKALALVAKAQRLWADGKQTDAISAFREAAALDTGNPDLLHDLGAAYFHCGRLSEAAEASGSRPK
jgi:hypothetical protein